MAETHAMNEAEFEIALEATRLRWQERGVHVEFERMQPQSGALRWRILMRGETIGALRYWRLPQPRVEVVTYDPKLQARFNEALRQFGFPVQETIPPADQEEARTPEPEEEWWRDYVDPADRQYIRDYWRLEGNFTKLAKDWRVEEIRSARDKISDLRKKLIERGGLTRQQVLEVLPYKQQIGWRDDVGKM